jgi:hypothetical protein
MAEILRYVLVDEHDNESLYEYDTMQEARDAAGSDYAILMRTYIYDDSELVWTPNGADFWPPKEPTND